MQNEQSSYNSPLPPGKKGLHNKALVWILVSLCAVLVLFFIFAALNYRTHQFQPTNTNLSITSHVPIASSSQILPLPHIDTVVLTDKGFSPAKVIIQRGTAIKWINSSSTDNASVSSDDYPTNQRFPELNLGKFNRGASLVHVFETSGTFTYHNQFNPKQTGTIVVE